MEDKYVYVELKTLQVYQCFTNYSVYEPFQLWSMLTYIKKFSVRMYSSRNYITHTHTHTRYNISIKKHHTNTDKNWYTTYSVKLYTEYSQKRM